MSCLCLHFLREAGRYHPSWQIQSLSEHQRQVEALCFDSGFADEENGSLYQNWSHVILYWGHIREGWRMKNPVKDSSLQSTSFPFLLPSSMGEMNGLWLFSELSLAQWLSLYPQPWRHVFCLKSFSSSRAHSMCHLLQKASCKSPLPPAKYDLSPSPSGCHNALYFPLTSSQSAYNQHSLSVLLVPESELLKTGGTSFFLSKFGKGQMWSYHLPTFRKCPVCSLLTYLNFRHLRTCWISSPGPRWHLSAHLILPQTHHPHLTFPGWSFCSFHTNSFTKMSQYLWPLERNSDRDKSLWDPVYRRAPPFHHAKHPGRPFTLFST